MALPPPPPPPPPPPWSAPPLPVDRPGPPVAVTILGIGIAMVLLLGMVSAVLRLVDDDGPPHPDEWDPRVADIAAFVEDERGHAFDHPVYVDFLSPSDYTEATTDDEVGLTEADRAELDRYAATLRALGVASGEIDLFAAYNQVADSGTLAFYDPNTERIQVRGTTMTPGLEVTLAHELTHALQDQSFDLSALQDADDPAAATGFRALAEGDAMRVEEAYEEEELTEAERAAYEEEYDAEVDRSEDATLDVPDYVAATFQAPYALGGPFVRMLYGAGGNEEVDDAFGDPPTTGEHLFEPTSFLDDEGADDLELEDIDEDELIEAGVLGPTDWYLILVERIDPDAAFAAAQGWAGDAYAVYEDGDVVCVQAAFVGDTEDDEAEMAAALDDWVGAMPGGEAEVRAVDGHPGFVSCDPGPDVDMDLREVSTAALAVPSLWGYLVADAAGPLGTERARCYADEVVTGLTFEQITDPDGKVFTDGSFTDRVDAALEVCAP